MNKSDKPVNAQKKPLRKLETAELEAITGGKTSPPATPSYQPNPGGIEEN